MPIYVYRCQECRETFERLVPMSANSATALCPRYGAQDARKQLASFATLDRKERLPRVMCQASPF